MYTDVYYFGGRLFEGGWATIPIYKVFILFLSSVGLLWNELLLSSAH